MEGLVGDDEGSPLTCLLVTLHRIEVDDDHRPPERAGQAGHVSRSADRYAECTSDDSAAKPGSPAAASQASASRVSRRRRSSSSTASSITASCDDATP